MAYILLRTLVLLTGIVLIGVTLLSAIRTFVLPRGANDPITRMVFLLMRKLFDLRVRFLIGYTARDRIMAMYAPISLLLLLPVWYMYVWLGYGMVYWALGVSDWQLALLESGSSLLTLGYQDMPNFVLALLSFSEATIGLLLVALLISYLPTMYAAFSRREAAVTLLEVRAGDPPSAVEMIMRYHRIHGLGQLGEVWENWETWFADVEESHTSLAALVFFRSPQANHSWVTAAGAVLDCAALTLSLVDIPADPRANLCIRAGYLALRRISDYFMIQYDPHPLPTDPIHVTREDFERACEELSSQGVPIKADLEQAWLDFAGWRVNYDRVLLALAQITMAPKTPWISDRAL